MNFEKQPPMPLDYLSQQLLSGTPLHFACYAGDSELVDLILSKTRTYNNNDEAATSCIAAMIAEEDSINGWTPAHWAAFYGQLNCLMKLHVRPHVGFDTPTVKSHTSPLHLAAQSGAILCLKWLLQCGASINRQDFMGETPLHKAAKAGNIDTAAMLVSHGAYLDLRNQRGCTPGDLVELGGLPNLPSFLRSKEPQMNESSSLSISDLNVSVPFPSSIPPLHLPHPDHAKYNKFPYVNNHHVDKSLLYPQSYQDSSSIVMNGVSIGNVHTEMNHVDTDMSDSISGSGDIDTLPSALRTKRSLENMESSQLEVSGFTGLCSPKRRRFSSKNGVENFHSEMSDACNNNITPSCDAFTSRCDSSSDIHKLKLQHTSPLLAQSSVLEHQETMSAEQGYDSSVMNSMHDFAI